MHNHRNEPEILCADHCHRDNHMVREEYPMCSPHSHLEHVVRHQVEHVLKNKTGHVIVDGTSSKKFPTSEAVSKYVNEKLKDVSGSHTVICKVGCGTSMLDVAGMVQKEIALGSLKATECNIETDGKSLMIAIPEGEVMNQVQSSGIRIPMEKIGNQDGYNVYKSQAKLKRGVVEFTIG